MDLAALRRDLDGLKIEDNEFIARSRAVNAAGLRFLGDEFARRGIEFIPAYGNFLTFRISDAAGVFQRLLRQGVIVRPIAGYGMPDWLRVTIGSEAQNKRFLAALDAAVKTGG